MSNKVTLEIDQEVYNQLVELAKEMTTQDMRGTRMPHMFQIRDWKKVYDAEMNGNNMIWLDRNDNIEIETVEELLDYLKHSVDFEFDEDEVKEMWDSWKDMMFNDDLKDWFEENGIELEEYSYSLEPEYTNCFLTAKAAQEHLDSNYYHYHKNADVYLNHAWRNPEADLVSGFLCGLVGKDLHT